MGVTATESSSTNDVVVDVLAGSVAKNGVPVAIGSRERVIVIALGVYRAGLSPERLANLVYCDEATSAGAAALRVYIHRLRRRVAPDFIVSRNRVYGLGPEVRTAIRDEKEPATRALLRTKTPEDLERLRLYARHLRAPIPPELEDYDWYVGYAVKLQRIGRELTLNLAKEMAERERHLDAIQISTELTFEDPCDEEAWHEVIRAQLAIGQRSAALHGFRFLQSALEKDLGMKPSSSLSALLSV